MGTRLGAHRDDPRPRYTRPRDFISPRSCAMRVSRVARVVPVCVRCACRARDARRVRVRVIRFAPLGFPQKQNKKLIKTITYPSFTDYFGIL